MINYITNPGTAFNRAAYEAAGSYYNCDLDLATDYDQFLRMSKAKVNIIGLDEAHVCYRKHAKAVTHDNMEMLHEAIMSIRMKNNIKPFELRSIADYALPELAASILNNEQQKELWTDDRFVIEK